MSRILPPVFIIASLLAFPNMGLCEVSIPSDLKELDDWWEAKRDAYDLPSLAEIGENGPNQASTVRVFDLLLQRYHSRMQTWLAHSTCREVREEHGGSLMACWAQAWHVWLVTKYPREEATEDDLRRSVIGLPGEQVEALQSLALAFPDDLTGALAVRMLGLAGGSWESGPPSPQPSPPEAGGEGAGPGTSLAALADRIEVLAPGSMAACVIGMQRGTEAAAREDWEAASRYWLTGIQRYPFEQELPECREKLSEALVKAGDEVQARLLAEWPADQDVVGLTESLIRIREARSRAEEGNHAAALESLAAAMGIVRERVGESPDWNELLQEMEAEAARIRVAVGLGDSADDFLEALRGASDREFLKVLEEGLEKCGEDASFCAAAFAITRDRLEDTRLRTERDCWAAFVTAEGSDVGLQCRAFRYLVDCQVRYSNIMRMAWERSRSVVKAVAPAMKERAAAQEEALFDSLEAAEEFLHGVNSVTPEGMDLADTIYASYRAEGITNLPERIYLHLAGASPAHREELARRAERMGEIEESIAILRMMAESQEMTAGESYADDRTLRELLRVLVKARKYAQAAEVACGIAENASGTPGANTAWYDAVDLLHRAKNYAAAHNILMTLLSVPDPDEEWTSELEKLLAVSKYGLGRYEEARAMMDKLEEQGVLLPEQQVRFTRMRAYTYVYRQDYARALAELQNALQQYGQDFAPPERMEMERIVEKLSGFEGQ